jgi:hypothetical protein
MKILYFIFIVQIFSCNFKEVSKKNLLIKVNKSDSLSMRDTTNKQDLYKILDPYFKKIDGTYKY